MLRAYHYIRLTSKTKSGFLDNLVAAYNTLNTGNKIGIMGHELKKLVLLLLKDINPEIVKSIIRDLNKNDNSVVTFNEFVIAINICLLYEGKK